MMMSFQDVILLAVLLNYDNFFSGTASEFRMKMIITSPRKCKRAENLKSCLERTRHVKYALLR